METHKIIFTANNPDEQESHSGPIPIGKTIPQWYRQADRYAKNPATGDYWEMPDIGGKIPTWKACPAVYDVMGSGYTLKTPCDIEFAEDKSGNVQVRILDEAHQHFLTANHGLPVFVSPRGYHQHPLAWCPAWSTLLPEGHSALYTHPINRFELPFMTASGIVDHDLDQGAHSIPFFILKGVSGIVPAGTAYAQLIPFLREHWQAEYDVDLTPEQMQARNRANSEQFRRPDGGIYLREVWERRKYQ